MTLILENALAIANSQGYAHNSMLIDEGRIRQIGNNLTAPPDAQRMDVSGCIVMPGLVNTHHHMFQSMTRAWSADKELFDWLTSLWPIWGSHNPVWHRAATAVAVSELLLSGCTTTADHHYLPLSGADNESMDAQIATARDLGIRLVLGIGSMDVNDQQGGLAPASLCEDQTSFISRAEETIQKHHKPESNDRLDIALAPCHPLAVTSDLARSTRDLARKYGVRLHTHSAEGRSEEAATIEATGLRPLSLLQDWGLLGPDVWLAHCIHFSEPDLDLLASTGTSVSTCPSSNLRLGSGVAPIRRMLDKGVTVSLGVDGSASNDGGNMLHETRQLMLASRMDGLQNGLTIAESLKIATSNGADALGRTDIGTIEVGKRADLAVFDTNTLNGVGTEFDPIAGLLLSPPAGARHVLINGNAVVQEYELVYGDYDQIVDEAKKVSRQIALANE